MIEEMEVDEGISIKSKEIINCGDLPCADCIFNVNRESDCDYLKDQIKGMIKKYFRGG